MPQESIVNPDPTHGRALPRQSKQSPSDIAAELRQLAQRMNDLAERVTGLETSVREVWELFERFVPRSPSSENQGLSS